jgi:hypothetical protein
VTAKRDDPEQQKKPAKEKAQTDHGLFCFVVRASEVDEKSQDDRDEWDDQK